MDQSGAVVQFSSVGKHFGSFQALSAFTCRVEAGEFVTLLGPSGSGKTTALNIVAGFLDADEGDVEIGGQSVRNIATERRNIGMVFQHYSLFPHMTVRENVRFPLRMRGVGRKESDKSVDEALELVQLSEFGARRPKQLSGGQQQRVAFARAVVFRPKVLLMDEPLAALDLKLREAMQLEIKRLRSLIGCTVIYVTHDQGEALTLSDKIVVMEKGRISQIGSPHEIYDAPKTRFVAEFIGQTNLLRAQKRADGVSVSDIGATINDHKLSGQIDGDGYFLSVRPEHMRRISAGTSNAHSEVRFRARMQEALFLGDSIRYTAKTEAGKDILFQEHRLGGAVALGAGSEVDLGFGVNDVTVVRE